MKNFRLNLIFRILIFSATVFTLFYLMLYYDLKATVFILVGFSIYQIYSLIKFVDETNREIKNFLLSIKYSDFSQSFSNHRLGKSFKELNDSFNEVISKFQKTRAEKEEHYRYLNTVMQHVGVGLLSFDEDGNIEFINNSAKRLLKIKFLNNIKSLNKIQNGLSEKLTGLKPGQRTTLKIIDDSDILQLILHSTEFRMRGKLYKLISFQNIHIELEDKEIDAWQKLIRVLTHEIMNSVTPISSLASTVNHILINQKENDSYNEETISDIKSAVKTIQKRSDGLIHFVNDYRSLTKIPKPNFQIVKVSEIFKRIHELMESDFVSRGISFTQKVNPEHIKITCDPDLVEQVILNLIINSIHALANSEKPKIVLFAGLDLRGKFMIEVIDNGSGLSEELIEKVFIPFFSTKKEGSGIGLSLSKQIIKNHGGTIGVKSVPNKDTVFTIKF